MNPPIRVRINLARSAFRAGLYLAAVRWLFHPTP